MSRRPTPEDGLRISEEIRVELERALAAERERVQLLESCVRGLIRVMMELGAEKRADAFVKMKEAANLAGEELRG